MPAIEQLEAFSPAVIAADLELLQIILADFFRGISSADWERPMEKDLLNAKHCP